MVRQATRPTQATTLFPSTTLVRTIHGKTVPKLEQLYDEIIQAGYTEPVIYPLDYEKITPEDCDTLKDVINKEFGKLDGLFNNAGWLGASTPIEQYDLKLWYRVMQINLNATFMITQACIPLLNHAHNHKSGSSIVFNLDDKNSAYWGAYGVAKAGLRSLKIGRASCRERVSSPV